MAKAAVVTWSSGKSAQLILVSGGEDFLASRYIRGLKSHLRKQAPDLEISEVEGAEYNPGQLYDLTAPSLFGGNRLVIINGVESCTDALIEDGLLAIGDIADDCTLVFRHSSGVRGKKLLEAIREHGSAIEVNCEKISKEVDRIAFATAEFKSAGRSVSTSAVRKLVEAFGDDVAGLAAACTQLLQDVADSIDDDIVERYFSGKAEVDTFKIIDAAVAGDAGTALTLLRQAFETGSEPAALVGAFAHRIRVLAKVLNNRNATNLGLQTWAMDKARREVAGWTEIGMANVVQELAVMDAASKGFDRAPQYASERFVLLVANKGVIGA